MMDLILEAIHGDLKYDLRSEHPNFIIEMEIDEEDLTLLLLGADFAYNIEEITDPHISTSSRTSVFSRRNCSVFCLPCPIRRSP